MLELFARPEVPKQRWNILPGVDLEMRGQSLQPGGFVRLLLITQHKEIDLSTYSSPSADFRLAGQFSSDPETGRVSFSTEFMCNPRNIFSIFHEMGHLTEWSDQYRQDPVESKRISAIANETVSYRNEKRKPPPEILQALLPSERRAWAAALNIARRIRHEHGINLFALFRDAQDCMGWIRATGLRTYEHGANTGSTVSHYTKSYLVHRWWAAEGNDRHSVLTPDEIEAIGFWSGGDTPKS